MKTKSSLPILDASLLTGSVEQRHLFSKQLLSVCYQVGSFYLAQHPISTALCKQILEKSRHFFSLPLVEKSKISISLSAHFRGYSQMKNERDWREQVHFGPEELAVDSDSSDCEYRKLQGPNLWSPKLDKDWQDTVMSFLKAIETLSQAILAALAGALGFPENYFRLPTNETPYILMKLLCYHPQPTKQQLCVGVAAHCDWSWITFLLQDDIGGLQVKLPNGDWIDADPISDTFVINIGELLQILTCGYLKATPHRVINHSSTQSRISIPIFINPALTTQIFPTRISPVLMQQKHPIPSYIESEHIHCVINPSQQVQPFVFGDSEWQRKGQGYWCYNEACCGLKLDNPLDQAT